MSPPSARCERGQQEMLSLSKFQSLAQSKHSCTDTVCEICCIVKLGKKTYLLRIKGTPLEMIVNSKHTCSHFNIFSEWRAPSGLADRPAVGGLRPNGGAGEGGLWKKVAESTH